MEDNDEEQAEGDEELDDDVESDVDGDSEADPLEPPEPDPADPSASMESIEEILSKKEGSGEEETLLTVGREERVEPLAVKVVPPQAGEFVCKRCFLVKHQSQLKDKKRRFCRDCA